MPGPISPKEIQDLKNQEIPEAVFEAFNSLIVKGWNGSKSTVYQDRVLDMVIEAMGDEFTRQMIFDNHWLDVEDAYEKMGWKVQYDRPAYNESYSAYYTFSK